MSFFTPFAEFVVSCMPHCVTTYLGDPDFGADSEKGIKVWSTSHKVLDLKRARPKHCRKKLSRKTATGVNGITKSLQMSSAYPAGFGAAVANIFCCLKQRAGSDAMFVDDLGAVVGDMLAKKPAKRKRQ